MFSGDMVKQEIRTISYSSGPTASVQEPHEIRVPPNTMLQLAFQIIWDAKKKTEDDIPTFQSPNPLTWALVPPPSISVICNKYTLSMVVLNDNKSKFENRYPFTIQLLSPSNQVEIINLSTEDPTIILEPQEPTPRPRP